MLSDANNSKGEWLAFQGITKRAIALYSGFRANVSPITRSIEFPLQSLRDLLRFFELRREARLVFRRIFRPS